MTQIQCEIPDELAQKFQKKAQQAHLSVSKYLSLLIEKDMENQWPEGYFELFGSWNGEPLERPNQSDYENRESFD